MFSLTSMAPVAALQNGSSIGIPSLVLMASLAFIRRHLQFISPNSSFYLDKISSITLIDIHTVLSHDASALDALHQKTVAATPATISQMSISFPRECSTVLAR